MDTQWELVLGTHELTVDPSWQEIQQALLRMDGDSLNQVGINRIGLDGLFAGGGNDNHYMIIHFSEEVGVPSLTLMDPSATGPDVEIHIRTLESYPARYSVGLPLVIQVFGSFFREGNLPGHLVWEPEQDTSSSTP